MMERSGTTLMRRKWKRRRRLDGEAKWITKRESGGVLRILGGEKAWWRCREEIFAE